MKVSTALVALVLPLLSLAVKKSPATTFNKYHTKSLSSAPLSIDDDKFAELTKSPRDYGVAVCLTALGAQFGCKICQELKPEWGLLAKTWINGEKNAASRTLFATLDFADGRGTFQLLKLETAPVILYFPPTTGEFASAAATPLRYDFTSNSAQAEALHAWLTRNMNAGIPTPQFRRPFNWLRFGTITTLVLGAITGVFVAWPVISFVVQSRNLWAIVSIIGVLLFTSGHMFNSIRGTPYVAGDGRGGVQYFAPGFSNQFGMESQIIAAIYGILGFATVGLAVQVPRMADSRKQGLAVIVWCGVTYVVYGILMSVFRIKNGGFPYTLPPF